MCFVIMPFHEPFNEYYEVIIKSAVCEAGLIPQRADEILGPGAFMEDVVNGIRSSNIIIAELTGRNANVFYELGLAHGLAKPVIMITQNKEDVPSDLKALKWIYYTTISPHWSDKLQQDLASTLNAILNGNDKKLLFPFIHPDTDTATSISLLRRLREISGTQKQILDYIKECKVIHQRLIEKRFSHFPPSELFYRLEHLRLLGFLISTEIEKDSSGKAIYSFQLSGDAEEIYT
jgi:hypothetical protein